MTVTDIGKAYRFYPSRWARLSEWLAPGTPRHELQWVLRHVTFSVAAGESVGIIGRNGAGKSTLLKLITGTTQPSEGEVRAEGRVAALLELGIGFHPEFTGRENAFMTGQLMGVSEPDIAAAMPQIEGFAEIGRYIDEPLRTYSSGMQVRLAFSVATAFRPDILIVDEALAVGDLYFQHKCYARIRQFRAEGMTLLFVSHDPGAIKSLCDRAILLDAGGVRADDRPDRRARLLQRAGRGAGERRAAGAGSARASAPACDRATGARCCSTSRCSPMSARRRSCASGSPSGCRSASARRPRWPT